MTATSLFDVLKRHRAGASGADGASSLQLAHLAGELIDSALADLERLKGYEKEFARQGAEDPAAKLDLLRSIWHLYQQWANDAKQVLVRARSLSRSGPLVEGLDQLENALGRVLARLSLTPEQVANGMTQARRGQITPAGELRDELHARLRG